MKKVYIISLLLSLFFTVGCKKDVATEQSVDTSSLDTSSIVISMQLESGDSDTRAIESYSIREGVLGSGEYVVNSLRVYVFASDGELDTNILYENLNANHIIEQTIEVPKDLSKELYFVANEPDDISDELSKITTIEELEDVEFTIADGMNFAYNADYTFPSEDFLMPMTAEYDLTNALSDVNIYVKLIRAVARVDLYLDKGLDAESREIKLSSATILSADGVSYDSNLFEGDINEASRTTNISTNSSDIIISTNTPQRVLSFYTAERKYSSNSSITISVDKLLENGLVQDKKSVTLDDTNKLTELNRNYIYQIYATYNGTEIDANDKLEVMGWDDVVVDGEIEGVLMAVDNEVAMDWLLNGNSYTSKSISFGSNKPIEFYLPVAVNGSDDAVPDYEFKLFEFSVMSAGESYDLTDIDLDDNFIFATSWIKSAIVTFTSDKSGYIVFTYAPANVNYKMTEYPIRIKSDNVTKQMKAVYDNGYFPTSILSDDWKERAPGGVVFAKRGVSAHPNDTPEILYRDEDGYYRGDYSTTADDGTRYCQEEFGDDWYMPSYYDMIEIATNFDKLGVSYRFQNNGSIENSGQLTESVYWSSSASSEYPGKYWSADFMYREYMNDGLLERLDGTESHFVRCVMDLQ